MVNRCVDIVVGLAAGSEGKGKLVSIIADRYSALVRTGGPNAAHTVYYNGEKLSFHQIPCGSIHAPDTKLVLGANAQIDIDYLKKEIELLKKYDCWLDGDGNPRLLIDPYASIIDTIDKVAENGGRMPDCGEIYFRPRDCETHNSAINGTATIMYKQFDKVDKLAETCIGCPMLPKDSAWAKIGSTTHGAGANLIRKTARGTSMVTLAGQQGDAPVKLAKDDEFLSQFVGSTVKYLNDLIDDNKPIMLEGTQGSLLSLHHSYWPKATSRDTNAGNWVTDAGISPLAVRDIYGVTRTFPIRVDGNSGPLSGTEISWDEVTAHATGSSLVEWKNRLEEIISDFNNRPHDDPEEDSELFEEMEDLKSKIATIPIIEEVTTATKRKRRVFTFGEDDFNKAISINRPTKLVLTFVDYLNIDDADKASWYSLSQRTRDWITTLESKLGVFFDILSTGPLPEDTIFRKSTDKLTV